MKFISTITRLSLASRNLTVSVFAGVFIYLLISVNLLHAQEMENDKLPAETPSETVTSLMEVVPADPLFVLQIKSAAEAFALIEDTLAWQQLMSAPMWEVLCAAVDVSTEVTEFHRLARPGLKIPAHLLGGEVLFVVPKFRAIWEVSPMLLVRLDRDDDLSNILAAAVEVMFANVDETTKRTYGRYTYRVTKPVQFNEGLAFGVVDNFVVVSLGEATLRKVIDLREGKSTESLANDADFSQHFAPFRSTDTITNFQATSYVDFAEIHRFAQLMYPVVRYKIPPEIQPLASLMIGQLSRLESIAAVSNLTGDGLRVESDVRLNPDASPGDLLTSTTHDSIRFAPKDSASYYTSNLINLPKLWEVAMCLIEAMPREVREQIKIPLDTVQEQLHIDIEADLFSWMGDEIAIIDTGEVALGTGEGFSQEVLPLALLLVQTTSPTRAAESLLLLTRGLQQVIEDVRLEWGITNYLGIEIHSLVLDALGVQPCYAVTDEYVLISTDISSLKTSLDSALGTPGNLSTATLFQELRTDVPEMVNAIGYANPARSAATILDALPEMISEMSSGAEVDEYLWSKPIMAQSIHFAKALMQTFVGSIGYTVKDGNGLRSYSRLKVVDLDEDFLHIDPPEAKLARSLAIADIYFGQAMPAMAQPYLSRAIKIAEALLVELPPLESQQHFPDEDGERRRLIALTYSTLGHVHHTQEKWDEAIAAYKQAIAIDPTFASAYVNIGLVYHVTDQIDEAISAYKQAIGIDKKLSYAHYNLACGHALKNEKALAIASLREAIDLNRYFLLYCQTDSDFDMIRRSPEFQQLIRPDHPVHRGTNKT